MEGLEPPIQLRYFLPAPDLRAHISAYYLFRASLPRVRDQLRADLGQIRFMMAGAGVYQFREGKHAPTPEVALIGPTTAACHFEVVGPVDVLGIALLPAGWAALVQDDASRHADAVIDAVSVFGPLLDNALDALRCSPFTGQRISIADAVMRALLSRVPDAPHWFTRLADQWLVENLSPPVDLLVQQSGLSARQVERLSRRIYGAPPKLLARKYRALRVVSLLSVGDRGWSEIVGDAYYDQSHFIRDFKRFTGLTPSQFKVAPAPVLRLTTAQRRLADGLPTLAAIS